MVIGPSGVSMTLTHTNAGALEICGCGRLMKSGGAGVSDEIAVYLGGGSKFEMLDGIIGEGIHGGSVGGIEIGCSDAICNV